MYKLFLFAAFCIGIGFAIYTDPRAAEIRAAIGLPEG